MDARDAAWVQELVYGTFRLRGRIDYILEGHVRRGIARLEPDVLDVLRLGAYQLLEMGSVPAYAAVSQSVELVRGVGGRGADRLVNGVLQSIGRDPDARKPPDFRADPIGHLSTWGSHPRWLVERWVARFGADGARDLVEANNRRPELYLRVVGIPMGMAAERLAAAGIAVEPVPAVPGALRVLPPATASEALAVVPAIVQDPAAGLVVQYSAVPPGARVADLCASPGGKAVALAERVAYVVAADVSWQRVRRLRENRDRLSRMIRLGLGIVVADARMPPVRPLDAVLVDAPCTGTGTFRRHPDGKWRIREEELGKLVALQAELLDGAATAVAVDGLLIYATCSLEPEENEAQVEAFLDRHPNFERASAPPDVEARALDEAGQLSVRPHELNFDGAFAARLRRVA